MVNPALSTLNNPHLRTRSEQQYQSVDYSSTEASEASSHDSNSSEHPTKPISKPIITTSVVPSDNEPRRLGQLTFWRIICDIADLALALLPLLFLALGVAASALHGRLVEETKELGERIEAAARLGPTIFPVLFVAVAGRSLKTVAIFLTQNGATLGTLELLLASQSVWGTFQSQFSDQRLTVLGIHLLLLWSLSPLGGQASLRLVEKADKESLSITPLRYLHTGFGSSNASVFTASDCKKAHNRAGAADMVYAATILGSADMKLAATDNWGNVRIPRLEAFNQSGFDSQGWRAVSAVTLPEQYSSLLGVPIVGLAPGTNATLNLETSYMSLKCSPWSSSSMFKYGNLNASYGDWSHGLGEVWRQSVDANETFIRSESRTPFHDSDKSRTTTFFLDTTMSFDQLDRGLGVQGHSRNESIAEMGSNRNESRYVFFGSLGPYEDISTVNCAVKEIHVEAAVECVQNQNCRVSRIRRSLDDKRPALLTPLESGAITSGIFKNLPFAMRRASQMASMPTELFINDTLAPTLKDYHVGDTFTVDLSRISPSDFSRRLSLVLNTYYYASLGPGALSGDRPKNLSLYGPDFNNPALKRVPLRWPEVTSACYAPFASRSTEATVSHTVLIYRCNFVWLAILLLSTSTLLLVGLVGQVLKWRTIAPDMLGYVSSLTYDNPYVVLPEGGTVLDGMDRAIALKDLRVAVGDVRGDDDIGHVAFTAGIKVRKLEKGRLYA